MKNRRKLIGFSIIAVVVMASLIAIACDQGSGSGGGGGNSSGGNSGGNSSGGNSGGTNTDVNPFVGTWLGEDYEEDYYGYNNLVMYKLVFTKTEWHVYILDYSWDEKNGGTYYLTGNNNATLRGQEGLIYTAAINGNKLLIISGGDSLEFTRQ